MGKCFLARGELRPSPDRQALQSAARLIEAASFPLIFAGNGVIRGSAAPELRELARTHGIPVVNTFMAKGCMPYDDPLALLSAGLQSRDYAMAGFEDADVVIAIGYDLVEHAPAPDTVAATSTTHAVNQRPA